MPELAIAPGLEGVRRLQAIMLSPEDELWRQQYLAHCKVTDLADEARLAGFRSDQDIVVPFSLLMALAAAPAAREIGAEEAARRGCGEAVGAALFLLSSLTVLGKAVGHSGQEKFSGLAADVAEIHDGKTLSWFNNRAWGPYKPSAHLWAAWVIECQLGDTKIFPCGPETMRRFLALAAVFFAFGCEFIPKGQSRPLLDKETAWSVLCDLTDADHAAALKSISRCLEKARLSQ
jgi:hypothetical protein